MFLYFKLLFHSTILLFLIKYRNIGHLLHSSIFLDKTCSCKILIKVIYPCSFIHAPLSTFIGPYLDPLTSSYILNWKTLPFSNGKINLLNRSAIILNLMYY